MEQLAPGRVLLTAGTLLLAEGFVQVTPLGPVPIKGLGEPVEVFELAAGAARTRFEAAARRGLTRLRPERGDGAAPRRPRPGDHGHARWSPWSGSRAWASRVSSGSSSILTAGTAASS